MNIVKITSLFCLLFLFSNAVFGQNNLSETGNIGIGTTNPGARLDIKSNTGQTESFARFQVSDAPGDYLLLHNATGEPGRFAPTVKGHSQTFTSSGLYLIGSTNAEKDITSSTPLITFDARRNDGALQTRQLFGWQSYGQRKMTMLANGNLGIGTVSPKEKLHLEGNFLLDSYNLGNDNGIFFRENFNSTNKYNLSILNYDHSNSGATPDGLSINAYDGVSFSTGSNSRNERMRINSQGNVGIGTTNPLKKFQVSSKGASTSDQTLKPEKWQVGIGHADGEDKGEVLIGTYGKQPALQGHGSGTGYRLLLNPFSGNIGVGMTNSPNSRLQIQANAGQSESFLHFNIADASEDYFRIQNSTGSANQFIPVVKGHHVSDDRYSIQFMGTTSTANDTGNNAIVNFDARRTDGPIQSRPLFVWTSYTNKLMTMHSNGNLSIGTRKSDGYKLSVNGKVRATEVKVYTGWADYVFKDDYQLPTLEEVANHIEEKGHLINIPSEAEVAENGIQLGEMNAKLLEKIEELTLYTINQDQQLKEQKAINAKLGKSNEELAARLDRLEKLISN